MTSFPYFHPQSDALIDHFWTDVVRIIYIPDLEKRNSLDRRHSFHIPDP